jgi:hypothetical protein
LVAYREGVLGDNLYVVAPDSSQRRRLTNFPTGKDWQWDLPFAWSSAGKIVAANSGSQPDQPDPPGAPGVYEIDPASGSTRTFSSARYRRIFDVSPDGGVVALQPEHGVALVSVADGTVIYETRFRSPRPSLRLKDLDPIAVSLSP